MSAVQSQLRLRQFSDAAIEFCDSTNVMRQTLDTFFKDVNNYDIDLPNRQLRVSKILAVCFDDDKT